MPRSLPAPDPRRFADVHQLGGIRTGTLDAPGAAGGVRVALVDTGAGLRFTVALDRGGDIVDAHYHAWGLAYLSPNGLRPPDPAYHAGDEWLRGWPGGLLTTCGPEYIGGSRVEDGVRTSLHGRYSSAPAQVEVVRGPDPARGRLAWELGLVVRDTRVFGPVFEVRRVLRGTLGVPEIHVEDEVTNLGDEPAVHHWLYHCNLGYPLLDLGCRFVYRGPAEHWIVPPPAGGDLLQPIGGRAMNALKRLRDIVPAHAGAGERGLIVDAAPGRDGRCRVGIINPRLTLGLELSYDPRELPRLAHWQHYGPRGSFASALEPFRGSLLGSARDPRARKHPRLRPGETRRYRLRLRVLATRAELASLAAADGPVHPPAA